MRMRIRVVLYFLTINLNNELHDIDMRLHLHYNTNGTLIIVVLVHHRQIIAHHLRVLRSNQTLRINHIADIRHRDYKAGLRVRHLNLLHHRLLSLSLC